jgi:molecular chaperone GrpE
MTDDLVLKNGDRADENPPDPEAREALQRERDDLQDRLLRLTAEYDNYRKRTDRERRELSDAVAADLARDLLPALDDLERALAAPAQPGDQALRAGVELIHRQLLEALRRRNITSFESVGQQFDPSWHEALSMEAAPGKRDGEVLSEVRRGYRVGSRLLRPALVQVAKA